MLVEAVSVNIPLSSSLLCEIRHSAISALADNDFQSLHTDVQGLRHSACVQIISKK